MGDLLYNASAAYLAAYFGLTKILAALLESGHCPESRDTFDTTPLMVAAKNGYDAIVKLLVMHPAVHVNSKDRHHTPFEYAVMAGQAGIAEFLRTQEAIATPEDPSIGYHTFARIGPALTLYFRREVFLKRVSEQRDKLSSKGLFSWTPLTCAIHSQHRELLKLLLIDSVIVVQFSDKSSWNLPVPRSYVALSMRDAILKRALVLGWLVRAYDMDTGCVQILS